MHVGLGTMNAPDLSVLLEELHESGTSRFSASSVAHLFDLQLQELADLAKVHRNTLRTHPESPRVQGFLLDLVRLLCAVHIVQPDLKRAVFLVKNGPIPIFRHKTLLELVAVGRTNDAVEYLESIAQGYAG